MAPRYCYGPRNASYTAGGALFLIPWSTNTIINTDLPFTIGFDSASMPGGGSGFGTWVRVTGNAGSTFSNWCAIPLDHLTPWSCTFTVAAGTRQLEVDIWTDSSAYGVSFTNLFLMHESCTGALPAPCRYGTELATPGQFIYYLTPAVIDALLAEVGAIWAAPFFTAFWFTSFDARELCGALPPPVPSFDVSAFQWSPSALYNLLHSLAWWYFCQCTAGPITPVEPTKPVVPIPPGMPLQPTFPCDPAALCASLVAIQKALAAIAQTVGLDYNADTLMQRFALPFATIAGAVHSGLPSSGSFAVSRLVGMRAELVGAPPSFVLEGTPPYLWDLGWMSVSDGGAMLQEKRITRTSMDWLPPGMQAATTFGWFAKPGVTLRFTELQAEP